MRTTSARRLLIAVLIGQQTLFGAPAGAAYDIEAGRPLDQGALAGLDPVRTLGANPNLFQGESSFRIPIAVPPGTGGLAPSVALSYGSQIAGGLLGVGWAVSLGFPDRIERSTRDGAPEYDDALDDFELGGELLAETGTPGRYVTERFDHSRIEFVAVQGYWRVLRPDGTRLYYGFDPGANGSRLDSVQVQSVAPISADCPLPASATGCTTKSEIIPAGIPFAWYLDRIEDRNGNVVHVTWGDLGDPGVRYPLAMDYSGHVAGAVADLPAFGGADDGTLTASRFVDFEYELRPDVLPTFRTGFRREIRHRLAGVRSGLAPSDTMRHYVLVYDQSPASGLSRLVQVQERGSDDDPATAFLYDLTYTDGTAMSWGPKDSRWALPVGTGFLPIQFVYDLSDIDPTIPPLDGGVRLADVNADGYPDVINGVDNTAFFSPNATYLGGPDGFDGTPDPAWELPAVIVDYEVSLGPTGAALTDLDGDSRLDLIQRGLSDTGFNESSPANPPCSSGSTVELENGSLAFRGAWRNTGAGWAVASEHDVDPAPIAPVLVASDAPGSASYPFDQSCPIETFSLSTSIGGLITTFALDQGTRLLDVNGDGRDDIVYKRQAMSFEWDFVDLSPEADEYMLVQSDEFRHGVLLNSPAGLTAGSLNNFHLGQSAAFQAVGPGYVSAGFSGFLKFYDLPRWQFPQSVGGFPDSLDDSLSNWSSVQYCHAHPSGLGSDQFLVYAAASGVQHFADVNLDGLPDVLEGFRNDEFPSVGLTKAFLNNGYGWQRADQPPDDAADPPDFFVRVTDNGQIDFEIDDPDSAVSSCSENPPASAEDRGWRFVDVNGDGGPDLIGGPLAQVLLWNATAPGGSLWQLAPSWSLPPGVSFIPDGDEEGGVSAVRLADVDANGLVDLVVDDGAYLNQAEPPDQLETVTGPFGAVTTFDYTPSTAFEVPPLANPTVDGQMRMARPVWVVSRIDVDPGAASGQPVVTQEFDYSEPIYDIDDRAFRGFSFVRTLGPIVGSERLVTDTFFHVSDALRGRTMAVEVSSAPAADPDAGTLLFAVEHDYAYATGADAQATVAFGDGSAPGALPGIDPTTQSAAFDPFASLMSGGDADRATLAFRIGTRAEQVEGTASPAVSRRERSFDVYGNVLEERALGDLADPDDDVTTAFQYAILDTSALGPQVLLANRPSRIDVTGLPGSLPPDTVLTRSVFLGYDGRTFGGGLRRGNLTSIERFWTRPDETLTIVRVDQQFDVYGNRTQVSAPYDPSTGVETLVTTAFDAASQTFPISITTSSPGAAELTLARLLRYDLPGCGAPPGSGAVCESEDPNGQVAARTYDAFGREIALTGPNGFALATDYHDADRGTIDQQTEVFVRWDPDAGADPLLDPNALVERTFFDGLGRPILEQRSGRGSDLASRLLDYDAAGRAAAVTRWSYEDPQVSPGPATTFDYDVLGRLALQTLPDGTTAARSYAPRQVTLDVTEVTDGLVRKRVERVDGFGRLAEVDEYEDPLGAAATTSYAYDPFGQLVLVRDAMANDPSLCGGDPVCEGQRHTTEIRYDELGYRTRLVDPDTGTWLTDYAARGLPVLEEDPRGKQQELSYDGLGRLARRHPVNPDDPSEVDDVYTYGLAGTAPANGLGRLLRVDDEQGSDEFGYDDAGNVATHRRRVFGRRFDFAHRYDPLGRRIETDHPDGETATWHFDKALLARISSANGPYTGDYVADVTYDALDRPLTLEAGGSAGEPVVSETRTYDPTTASLERILATAGGVTMADLSFDHVDGLGNVRALTVSTRRLDGTLGSYSVSYAYDGLDRLAQVTAGSLAFEYTYDAIGNLRRKDDFAGGNGIGWEDFAYQDPDRPHAATTVTGEGAVQTLAFLYDAAGNTRRKSRSHTTAGNSFTEIAYDSQGRPTQVGFNAGAPWTLRWSGLGQRVLSGRGANTLVYPEPGYEYWVQGARANKHFFVAGRRVASSAVSFTAPLADAPGILSWRGPRLGAPPAWAFGAAYGALALALLGLALRPRPREEAAARRLRVRAALVTVSFAPALVASPCSPPQGPTASLGSHAEAALFYVVDHLGSTTVTVRADGTLRNRYTYGPFGDPGVQEGTPLHHQYAGAEQLELSTLHAMGPRLYDRETGRFLQPDLLVPDPGNPQAFNRYAYALNNPVNLVDASGFQAECGEAAPCGGPPPGIEPSFGDGGTAGLLQDTLGRIADLIDLIQSNPLGGILGPAPPQERTLEGESGVSEAAFQGGRPEVQEANVLRGLITVGRAVGTRALLAAARTPTGARILASTGLGGLVGGIVQGPGGTVARATLERAATAAGPTIQALTRLTQAPQVGQALSTAVGPNARALADAARAQGQLFSAQLPQGLVSELTRVGLAEQRLTQLGTVVGTELRFLPAASEFVAPFFQVLP